jgi:pyruvate carboxylase subunit B
MTDIQPLKITDTTFRDGHQSILATRMRTDDMLPLISRMDEEGLYSMEVWGGATFDTCIRYLGEDPWERLSKIREAAPKTNLQMLLRGQNAVGYRNYADDVVTAFVKNAAEMGIDIFRIFDALNDPRNFETAVAAVKASGKHFQAALSYSLMGRRLGGEVFTIEYFVGKAKSFKDQGADSICIKDMAGLLCPEDAFDLVSALKADVGLPVHLHTHYTSGMGSMSCYKAVEAGVDVIDCALAPFALRTGQPAVEPMVSALLGCRRDTKLNLDSLIAIGQDLEHVAPRYRDYLNDTRMSVIDTGVLKHQVPGGMLSNLISQLREAEALDKLDEVFKELPMVRKDLGSCPLVTPTSQIVGIQAVQNVLFGRYKMISAQVKDYAYGLYGRPPLPMDQVLREKALKDYARGQTPITCRAGDIIEPEMEKNREEIGDLAQNEQDLLIYALYPTVGRRFLEWKYGLADMPMGVKKGKTMARIKQEDQLIGKLRSGELTGEPHLDMGQSSTFAVAVGGESFEVHVAQIDNTPLLPGMVSGGGQPVPVVNGNGSKPEAVVAESVEGTPLESPMPGVVIRYDVAEGDTVEAGQKVMLLEAMKMENSLSAPASGTVLKLHYRAGDNVAKGAALLTIGG